MAQQRQSEAFDYKTKYEESENQLKHLKGLAHKAVADYEELQRKYDQNQKQYDELKVRLQETEHQLEQLQQALEPACNEYKELQDLYTIENKCRAEAEKYASTMVQENKKLKRQSQQLLEQISNATTFDPTQLKFDTIEEVEVDEGQTAQLKEKIEKLESMLESSRDRCHELEEERVMMHEKEHVQNLEIEKYEQSLKAANEKISELERVINNYNTLSEQAVREHEELKEKYEQEKSLRIEAEKYASNMLSQKNAVVRESTVVLASAMSDKRLQDAFMQIEELQKLLENERNENAQKIKELEERLEEGNSAKVHDLEQRLEVIIEESQAKSQQIKEMEQWKAKLEKECEDLTLKLDAAEQRFVPPPPPPPLPTNLFNFFRPAKKRVTEPKKPVDELAAKRQSAFDKALKEMMDRIKKGDTLKSGANRRRPSAPEIGSANKSSAMTEMGEMLTKLKMSRSKSVEQKHTNLAGEGQSDYEKIYNKIKGGTIGATTGSAIVSTTLARISEEKDADLKTSSGEKPNKSSESGDRLSTDL